MLYVGVWRKFLEKMSLWAKGGNKEVIEIMSEQLSETCQDGNRHPGFILLLPLSQKNEERCLGIQLLPHFKNFVVCLAEKKVYFRPSNQLLCDVLSVV